MTILGDGVFPLALLRRLLPAIAPVGKRRLHDGGNARRLAGERAIALDGAVSFVEALAVDPRFGLYDSLFHALLLRGDVGLELERRVERGIDFQRVGGSGGGVLQVGISSGLVG